MVIRIALGFLLLWSLVIAHYAWSAAHLHVFLGEIEFNAPEPARYRIGFLPPDRYRVVFWITPGVEKSDEEHALIARKLRKGHVRIEIRMTGFGGREVLEYTSGHDAGDWTYMRMMSSPQGWGGTAKIRSLPFECYRVTTRISGENEFLEGQNIGSSRIRVGPLGIGKTASSAVG